MIMEMWQRLPEALGVDHDGRECTLAYDNGVFTLTLPEWSEGVTASTRLHHSH